MSYYLESLLDPSRRRECLCADVHDAVCDATHDAIAAGRPLLALYAIAIGNPPRASFEVYAPSQQEAGTRHDCLKAHPDETMTVRRVRL